MKRNNVKMPEFDEIIFENRNKSYGAYVLRKGYKSVASLSVLCGSAFVIILTLLLSINGSETKASAGPGTIVISFTPATQPDFKIPDVEKAPKAPENITRNLKPVVTEDTAGLTSYIPTAQEIIEDSKDPDVSDTAGIYKEPVDQVIPEPDVPLTFVAEMPEFPGGESELLRFVAENIRYPEEALQNNIQGKVFLKFVVNRDGSVDRIEITKGADPLLDNEAKRVVASLPKFRPGKQNGEPVPVWYNIPVFFKIRN